MKAIIITRKQLIALAIFLDVSGILIGVSLVKLSLNDDLGDLRTAVAAGNVYVDSESRIYKCEVK